MLKVLDLARVALGSVAQAAAKVPVVEQTFHMKERLYGPWPEGPFLWMHGASLGECKMLLSLAGFLQQDLPGCPKILLTTQKAEILTFLKESAPNVESAIAPVDTPSAMKIFIQSARPIALILGENELWPGYLSAMRHRGGPSPVALVSGRYRSSLPGVDMSAIGFACMQTGADLARFLNVAARGNISKMMIGGDWKLLPWARSGVEVAPPENPTVDTAFISMHMAEWASLSRMLVSSIKRQEAVVLAPRHLSELDAFRKALHDLELMVLDWPLVQKGSVSVVGQYGRTKEVFAASRTCVIGGSFCRNLGVHDFWEPLQMGVATCIGPYASGKKECVESLVREGVVTQLKSTAGYSKRPLPDVRLVRTFLAHEKAKIMDSYNQLLDYLKELL